MNSGLKYVLRILRGENIASVLKSMTDEDYAQLQAARNKLNDTGLNRQQRRSIERKMDKARK